MKTKIVNDQLNCDVCGAKNCDEVWDAPASGRWGNFCKKCAPKYINMNGLGTHLKRPEAEPGWREKYPKFAALIETIKDYVDEYGQTYVDALEDSWALYGEEGLRLQINYILANCNPGGSNVKNDLKKMVKKKSLS